MICYVKILLQRDVRLIQLWYGVHLDEQIDVR
jgi:hypothetical protein